MLDAAKSADIIPASTLPQTNMPAAKKPARKESAQSLSRALSRAPSRGKNYAAPPRNPIEAVATCLRKSFNFRGRASRSEYWWFWLFAIVTNFIVNYIPTNCPGGFVIGLGVVGIFLLIQVSSIASGIRRLHDIGKSGWWILGIYFPFYLFIIFIFLFASFAVQDYAGFGNAAAMTPAQIDEAVTNYIVAKMNNPLFAMMTAMHLLWMFGAFVLLILFFTRKGDPDRNRFDA